MPRKFEDESESSGADSFVSEDLSSDDESDEVGSSMDGGSSRDRSGGRGGRDELKLAKTETQFVLCSKFMAYLVLFLSAVAAGFTAFYLTRKQETTDFENDVGWDKEKSL